LQKAALFAYGSSDLFYRVGLFQPNKRDKPNKPHNDLLALAHFSYSRLKHAAEYCDIHTMTGMELPTEYQGPPFF
jgi:hypothetical protein